MQAPILYLYMSLLPAVHILQVPISCLVELGAEACSRVLQSSELITCNTEVKRWSLAGEAVAGCEFLKAGMQDVHIAPAVNIRLHSN